MESVSAVNNALNQAILDQILLQQQLDALTQAQADQNGVSNQGFFIKNFLTFE